MNDEYLSREEMEALFDGLAADTGRTRAAFEAELDTLRVRAAEEGHLTFMEADDLDGLASERIEHLDQCGYCKQLVDTLYDPPAVPRLDHRIVEEITTGHEPARPWFRFATAPAMMLIGILIGAISARAIPKKIVPPTDTGFTGPAVRAHAASELPIFTTDSIRREFLNDSFDEIADNQRVLGIDLSKEAYFRTHVPFGSLIYREAKRNKISPELVAAIVHTDSDFRPRLVSQKSAQGLMQIVPETARLLGVSNPFNPEENIAAGTRYYRYLLDRYNGNEKIALAAYNAGPSNIDRFGGVPPFKETQSYLATVQRRRTRYEQRVLDSYQAGIKTSPGSVRR